MRQSIPSGVQTQVGHPLLDISVYQNSGEVGFINRNGNRLYVTGLPGDDYWTVRIGAWCANVYAGDTLTLPEKISFTLS